jgi:hypothetical protein
MTQAANMGEMRNVYTNLVEKSVGRNPFGTPGNKC